MSPDRKPMIERFVVGGTVLPDRQTGWIIYGNADDPGWQCADCPTSADYGGEDDLRFHRLHAHPDLGFCDKHGPIFYVDEGEPYCPDCDSEGSDSAGFVHNVIAHPLLWVWPRLGAWLHDRTEP